MSDGIFDFSELNKLAADLGHVSGLAGPLINSAVQVTSIRVKKAAAKSVQSSSKRWSALPHTIDYDIKVDASIGGSSIESEIGYNKGKKGALGTVREFGAHGSAPGNDLVNALHENEADFVKGLGIALAQAEKKAGL